MSPSFYHGKTVVVTAGVASSAATSSTPSSPPGPRSGSPSTNGPSGAADPSIETLQADLTRPEECRRAVADAHYVFHAAGAVSGAGVTSGASPMSGLTTNLTLTANIVEACWDRGVERLLVFGSSTGYPVTDHPVREEEMWSGPTHPSYFGYGWMRRYLERMCEFAAQRSKLGIALCRPTAVYGPGDDFRPLTSHVLPARIREAAEKKNPYVVWGTGEEVRDFLHVTDLIRGCFSYWKKRPTAIRSTSATAPPSRSRDDRDHPEGGGPHRLRGRLRRDETGDDPKRLVDTSKAVRLLGFRPEVPFEEGIRKTVDWYLEQKQG